MKKLFSAGSVAVKVLTSKTGNKFDTTLTLKPTDSADGFVQYEFKFGKSK